MVSDGIHGDCECQYVTGHDKHSVQHVRYEEQLPPNWPKKDLACIRNTGDMGVPALELPYYVAGIGSEDAESN